MSNMIKKLIGFTVLVIYSLPVLTYALPNIQEWHTENGLRVLLVEAHELPMVQMSIAFDAASSRDPAGKAGLASIVSSMLSQGAGSGDAYKNADRLAEEIEEIGAQYGYKTARDMSTVEMRSLSEEAILDKAVELFSLIISQPTFEQEVLDRELKRALIALDQQKQSPASTVDKAFFAAMYPEHVYGVAPDEQSVSAIARADLQFFHETYFVAKNAVLVMVGDLQRERAEQIAKVVSGNLAEGQKPNSIAEVKPVAADNIFVEFDAQQSHIRLGLPVIKRNNEDYYPLAVGNYVLGGSGLIARLAVEIREKRGLAYSVYSYFSPMREKGPFIVGLQTRNNQRDLALEVVRNTIKEFIEQGPTDEEILKAKKHITGGFALKIDSNKKIANSVLSAAFYNRPLDYLQTYVDKIESITPEQVRTVLKQYVDVDQLVQVVVGGKQQVSQQSETVD